MRDDLHSPKNWTHTSAYRVASSISRRGWNHLWKTQGAGRFLDVFGLNHSSMKLMPMKYCSPLRYCLKSLAEGLDPISGLEFVADWGPPSVRLWFHDYVKQLKRGRSLDDILGQIRHDFASAESELFIASIQAHAETGKYPEQALPVGDDIARHEEQISLDMELVIGTSRWWTTGLLTIGPLLGISLIYAVPQYADALLHTSTGRNVLGVAASLEIVGSFWAGALWGMQSRLEEYVEKA